MSHDKAGRQSGNTMNSQMTSERKEALNPNLQGHLKQMHKTENRIESQMRIIEAKSYSHNKILKK